MHSAGTPHFGIPLARDMTTLLDRLLEVAKDFEAERLQDQLENQKAKRALEQDLKSMTRTAQYRADEITFLEQQLTEVRSELEMAHSALEEERARKSADADPEAVEQRMRKEIVCLRFEVDRLRKRNERLAERIEGAGKENAAGSAELAAEIASEIAAMEKEDAEESFVPPLDPSSDTSGSSAAKLSIDFLRAVERGDVEAVESILTPSCICDSAYEQTVSSALSRVCAAAAAAAATGAAEASGDGEGYDTDDGARKKSELSKNRVRVARLLIAEGAATTPVTPTAPSALHLAAWSGDAGLVELLLAQPNPPVNQACTGKGSLSGTPLQLALASKRGDPVAVTKALLMSGADPSLAAIVAAISSEVSSERQDSDDLELLGEETGEILTSSSSSTPSSAHKRMGKSTNAKRMGAIRAEPSQKVRNVFKDCSVMFWNSSVRAYEAYSHSKYEDALNIWGDALEFIVKGKLTISGADKARLHYNRARAMCHLQKRVDALEELDKALTLSPDYTNARTLQAESYFELYEFDKCLASLAALEEAGVVEAKPKLVAIREKAREQKNLNHYQILGIVNGVNASEAEIRKAYRRQSMKWHPDKHQQNKDSKARATTTFKRLNEANQILGDTYSKMRYDAELEIQKEQEFEQREQERRRSEREKEEKEFERRRESYHADKPLDGQSTRYMYKKANYSDGARRGFGRADMMSDGEDEDDLEEDLRYVMGGYAYSQFRSTSRGGVRWPDRSKGEMLDSFDGDDDYEEEELMHDSFRV